MRKGLAQIVYLIIAASVLMMVAMVITFTATGALPEDNSSEISEETAVYVAEDHTWKKCVVERFARAQSILLQCCGDTAVTDQNLTYTACNEIRVSRNKSGDLRVWE